MAITIKKKRLTLKGEGESEAGSVPEAGAEGSEAQPAEGAVQAPSKAQAAAPVKTKPPSYMAAGIFAILTFIIMVALLVFEWQEYDYYADAFPMEGVYSAPVSSQAAPPEAEPPPAAAPAAANPPAEPAPAPAPAPAQ